jgi:hypothetical protein
VLQQSAAAHPALNSASPRVLSATPVAVTPLGYTYSREELAATGRLRDGGVLDLSAMVFAPEQFDRLVEAVAARLRGTIPVPQTYAQAVTQPAIPARSAPAHVLDRPVHMSHPRVSGAADAAAASRPVGPAPVSAAPIQPAPRAAPPRPVRPAAAPTHNMQTRSAVQPAPPPAGEQAETAEPPTVRTVAVHKAALPLSPTQWQVTSRGMPLDKAVAYCLSKGIKANMDLMVPEEQSQA